jgi:predicted permease
MKISPVTKQQWKKIAKTLLYVAISSVIGAAIAIVQDQPEMFGLYAPIVNVVLVTLKQVFTEDK